jgi:hypothetical protein
MTRLAELLGHALRERERTLLTRRMATPAAGGRHAACLDAWELIFPHMEDEDARGALQAVLEHGLERHPGEDPAFAQAYSQEAASLLNLANRLGVGRRSASWRRPL